VTGEEITFVASPRGWLPDEAESELDAIAGMLARAKERVDLQVLLHSRANRDHTAFTTLDDALRAAAARGVRVRLLVSHWGSKPGSDARATLDALAHVPHVEIRIFTIPPWSGGEIPFARVAHAKYLVIDRNTAWIGTSNWEGDYFLKSRNVGLVVGGGHLPTQLDSVFESAWSSAYAAPLSPTASGAAPP
jgi:phosphatidylserine/phosphatidylglycerophosphate/cardiolipin synthase-like enzyme